MITTIRVDVLGTERTYPADIAGYGEHLASGGQTVDLTKARDQARAFFRANRDEALTGVRFWVWMDESGLAYLVEFNRRGLHIVKAAAPMPGPDNVREVYVA